PEYVEVVDAADVAGLAARTGWPVVLKAVRGGYDGRGVWLLDGPDPGLVAQLLASGTPLMAEQAVSMRRELAMRPHNSGHWTIEGARTSQFEQHLRAVLDYPLGAPEPTAPVVVMANVL